MVEKSDARKRLAKSKDLHEDAMKARDLTRVGKDHVLKGWKVHVQETAGGWVCHNFRRRLRTST